jgi:hypothetical protein
MLVCSFSLTAASLALDEPTRRAADGTILTLVRKPTALAIVSEQPVALASIEVIAPEGVSLTADQTRAAERVIVAPASEATINDQPLRSLRDVRGGVMIRQGIFKNPGPHAVRATFVGAEGERAIDIPAGEGFFVGDVQYAAASKYKKICRCTCNNGTNPGPTMDLDCEPQSSPPPAGADPTCNCGGYEGVACDPPGDNNSGTAQNCGVILVPDNEGPPAGQ